MLSISENQNCDDGDDEEDNKTENVEREVDRNEEPAATRIARAIVSAH